MVLRILWAVISAGADLITDFGRQSKTLAGNLINAEDAINGAIDWAVLAWY